MLGIQFGVSETTAHEIFHKWVKYLSDILPSSLLEQIQKKTGDWPLIQEFLANFELTVDSYEQPIEKPCDYKNAKKFYSNRVILR